MVENGPDSSDFSLSIEVERNEPLRKKWFSPPLQPSAAPPPVVAAPFDWDEWREGSSVGKAAAARRVRYNWRGRRKAELHLKSWKREVEMKIVSDDEDSILRERSPSTSSQNPVNIYSCSSIFLIPLHSM